MGNHFLYELIFLILLGALCVESLTLSYNDLKSELNDLRITVDELKQKTEVQDVRINQLTELIRNQDIEPGSHRNKRDVYRRASYRRRRHAEIGFLVSLSRHQLQVKKDRILMFDHVITNIGNAFSKENGNFVCSIPGTYMFDLNLVADVGSYVEASIKLNGISAVTAVTDHRDRTSGWDQGGIEAILILKKGDVVSVTIDWPFETQTLRGEGKTTFSGYLLRRHWS